MSSDAAATLLALGGLSPHRLTTENVAAEITADPRRVREWLDELTDANLARWVRGDHVELHRLIHAYAQASEGLRGRVLAGSGTGRG